MSASSGIGVVMYGRSRCTLVLMRDTTIVGPPSQGRAAQRGSVFEGMHAASMPMLE